jgi:hypothetical protein
MCLTLLPLVVRHKFEKPLCISSQIRKNVNPVSVNQLKTLCMWEYFMQPEEHGWLIYHGRTSWHEILRCIQFGRIQGSFNLMYLIFLQVQARCN